MLKCSCTALHQVDDVLGGAAAWENVDSCEEKCPKCENGRAFFLQIQTRSADEVPALPLILSCSRHEIVLCVSITPVDL